MTDGEAGHALGVHPNRLRYAAPTGTVLIRWEGARQPTIWTVPPPELDPGEARLELARRYLHVFGPTTPAAFARWAGIGPRRRRVGVRGARQVADARANADRRRLDPRQRRAGVPRRRGPAAPARLLPSGDAYFLLQGADREVLVPDAARRRRALDPARLAGRRARRGRGRRHVATRGGNDDDAAVAQALPRGARAVEAEAEALPLPGVQGRIVVRWDDGERRGR